MSIWPYVKHAERFGCADVYETAREDTALSAENLGQLALHLRRVCPHWELTTRQKQDLMKTLHKKVPATRVAEFAEVSLARVYQVWKHVSDDDVESDGEDDAGTLLTLRPRPPRPLLLVT